MILSRFLGEKQDVVVKEVVFLLFKYYIDCVRLDLIWAEGLCTR